MKPCRTTILLSCTLNSTRAIRLLGRSLRTSHSPSPNRTAQRHADRPAVLDPHQVLPNRVALLFIEAAQPVSHNLAARSGAVEHDRDLAGPVNPHAALYIVHAP